MWSCMFLRMDIVIVMILFILIGIVLFRVLIQKKRPQISYRPFDYITGHSTKQFHDDLAKETEEKNNKN